MHKIKKHKHFHKFLKSTDRRNWKENVKNNKKIKKIKKQIVDRRI